MSSAVCWKRNNIERSREGGFLLPQLRTNSVRDECCLNILSKTEDSTSPCVVVTWSARALCSLGRGERVELTDHILPPVSKAVLSCVSGGTRTIWYHRGAACLWFAVAAQLRWRVNYSVLPWHREQPSETSRTTHVFVISVGQRHHGHETRWKSTGSYPAEADVFSACCFAWPKNTG